MHRRRSTCRICNSTNLTSILSLGSTPLANAFLRSADHFETERVFPLELYYCERCSLLQLLDVIDHEVLFRHYLYVSGTSDTVAAHNAELASTVCQTLSLTAEDLVVEIASNDGSLLKCVRANGVRVLGVEPAANIAATARLADIETVERFFGTAAAAEVRKSHGSASAILANNVLAHVDDPRDFLAGALALLRPNGAIIIEVPYLADLLERLEYDTVYHEHLAYFSVGSLLSLADTAGLSLTRVDRIAIHGGSLRVYFRSRTEVPSHAPEVLALAAGEQQAGLGSLERYIRFARQVEENRRLLIGTLEGLVAAGHTIAGYGAPAKGNTLLNYCGIDRRLLPYTVDKNPLKVGLFTPGMHIPVLPVSTLAERRPDYLLLLAWNLAEEIIRQQSDYHACGGRFIIPIPEPVIV